MRDISEENEQLRTQRDILLRQADRSALIEGEEERRLRHLKSEEHTALANAPRRSTEGLFKSSCSIDLLFLIDTTKSMRLFIERSKSQVRSILDDINRVFLNQAEVRVAVVGYKDHEVVPKIKFLDFTHSFEEVRSFIDTLNTSAHKGGDYPEDVLGALDQALKATPRLTAVHCMTFPTSWTTIPTQEASLMD